MSAYPKATAPITPEVLAAANERADRWEARYNVQRSKVTAIAFAAERASRKGYELDPDDVLELLDGGAA
jgi:hypothetical protein